MSLLHLDICLCQVPDDKNWYFARLLVDKACKFDESFYYVAKTMIHLEEGFSNLFLRVTLKTVCEALFVFKECLT